MTPGSVSSESTYTPIDWGSEPPGVTGTEMKIPIEFGNLFSADWQGSGID
jgi:hypothetical protein